MIWTCPDCGAKLYSDSLPRFCPRCADKKRTMERDYWDNKRAGMRSIANDIVAKVLGTK